MTITRTNQKELPPGATLVGETKKTYWATLDRCDFFESITWELDGVHYTEVSGTPAPKGSKPATAAQYTSFQAGLQPPSLSPAPVWTQG